MAKAIKNVIFDMGNVLMRFDGPYFSTKFTSTPEDAELLNASLFGSPLWTLLDSGTISHATMERYALAHLPERLHPNLRECMAHWPEYSTPLAATNELAERLAHEGYTLYLLTNASTQAREQFAHMPAMQFMSGVVVSAKERIMKPDPAIFHLLCLRFDLNPAECLFVDDNADNCAGAREVGMQTVHFTGDVSAIESALHAQA